MNIETRTLRGWGRYFKTSSAVYVPTDLTDLQRATRQQASLLARGGGRSFGDVALNHQRSVVDLQAYPRQLEFDAVCGLLHCSANHTQREILAVTCPQGWVLPAIPGSREITLGGMVAADAHGKNHYATGSFGASLLGMRLLLADGSVTYCDREMAADLFWATIGGLGLTGIVLDVTVQLEPLRSVQIESEYKAFDGPEDLFALIEANKDRYEYILGTADGRFTPKREVRGVVAFGNQVSVHECAEPWQVQPLKTKRLPMGNPFPGAGWLAAQVVNRMLASKFVDGKRERCDINHFFFPQDAIENWNLAYGRRGFLEYQCCFPIATARRGLAELFEWVQRSSLLCALVALKRFGAGLAAAPLSFPLDGYSVALDMPAHPGVFEKLETLDEIVVRHGGRVNPVKDSRLPAATLRQMYPELDCWLAVKKHYDPNNKFSSDMARRLELEVDG